MTQITMACAPATDYISLSPLRCLTAAILGPAGAPPLWPCDCLTSAPSGRRCSPGNISAWHQSPLPPKKVTRAWVSLPLHLLPAEVWGNFLQVVHGERELASRLCCSLWYCQERVMALCSPRHCSLTECDFGPVFLCITTTVSKKGMAKRRRERNGKTRGQEKTNSDMSSEHICEVPQQASGGDNAARDVGTKTLLAKPEAGHLISLQARPTLAHGISGRSAENVLAQQPRLLSLCQMLHFQ